MSPYKNLPNPPRTDVTNPKNKYCLPCNRDFNRRQAFVEHCRNVHSMKIKFAKPVTPSASSSPISPAKGGFNNSLRDQVASSNYNCDYCHKGFSSRSNKNRHMLLSCDAKTNGVEANRNELTDSSNSNQRALESSIHVKTNTISSSLQSIKRKTSSHSLHSRDNDFIYDPQIRPHRQGI